MTPEYYHILLADDDPEDKELLEEAIMLIAPEVVIYSVTRGRQAVEYLKNCHDHQLPGMIILDYNMPDYDGCQILDDIRGEERYQPIAKLIWSTLNSNEYRHKSLLKGANNFFVKPHNYVDLTTIAKEMMNHFPSKTNR